MTFAESLEQVRLSVVDFQRQIVEHFTPALEGLMFEIQRIHVDYLVGEPWYRHWRARWRLRKMRRWA